MFFHWFILQITLKILILDRFFFKEGTGLTSKLYSSSKTINLEEHAYKYITYTLKDDVLHNTVYL